VSQMVHGRSETITIEFDLHTIDGIPHGHGGYVRGCRCYTCVSQRREYNRLWMRQWRSARKWAGGGAL
jgi:hypothetical protein